MRVMISCGETSGDLYAGALAAELQKLDPTVDIFGFGGPRLRAAGARVVGDFSGFSVTGFVEPLRALPRLLAIRRRLVEAARATRPDVFVAIDFSGFNFRLMSAVRSLGIPIVYYVSPQLWAWRAGRMEVMKKHVARVLVIFPFEETVYRRAGVAVQFVGHPLVDMAHSLESRGAFLEQRGLSADAPTVALLPGSRRKELVRIGPVLAAALPRIRARIPRVQFVVARAPGLPDKLFDRFRDCVVVLDRTDDVVAAADVAITASGTATVQCALHERPMVVVYRVSMLEYLIGKRFLNVDMYAMPNLIADRRVVQELIQEDLTPARVADETVALLTDAARQARMREALGYVRAKLGPPGASARAARAVVAIAQGG